MGIPGSTNPEALLIEGMLQDRGRIARNTYTLIQGKPILITQVAQNLPNPCRKLVRSTADTRFQICPGLKNPTIIFLHAFPPHD